MIHLSLTEGRQVRSWRVLEKRGKRDSFGDDYCAAFVMIIMANHCIPYIYFEDGVCLSCFPLFIPSVGRIMSRNKHTLNALYHCCRISRKITEQDTPPGLYIPFQSLPRVCLLSSEPSLLKIHSNNSQETPSVSALYYKLHQTVSVEHCCHPSTSVPILRGFHYAKQMYKVLRYIYPAESGWLRL